MVVNTSESHEYIVAFGYASKIGEWVAIINCECGFLQISLIITINESCRCGERAASGSSKIKKPPLPNLFLKNAKKLSP